MGLARLAVGLGVAGAALLIPTAAFGQLITVGNSGGGSAQSGGNTAVGNESSNTATQAQGVSLLGINLGSPLNSSSGAAQVTTGPATATGNSSSTGVGQGSGTGHAGPQVAGVTNAGQANANTGGNTATGNASNNIATGQQTVTGGLAGIGLNVGGPTNVSNGVASVATGPADAVGNQSATEVAQTGGAGHGCGGGRGLQVADVQNQGVADANSGDNLAVGNASTNEATQAQVVEGGLLGLGVNVGGPSNVSSGVASVATGPADAAGNLASTTVDQGNCPSPRPVALVQGVPVASAKHSKLALTGYASKLPWMGATLVVLGLAALMVPRPRPRPFLP
jgi:hypothetical protein